MSRGVVAIILFCGALVAIVLVEIMVWVAQRAARRLLAARERDLTVPAWVNHPAVSDDPRAAALVSLGRAVNRQDPRVLEMVRGEHRAVTRLYGLGSGDVIKFPALTKNTPVVDSDRGV